MSKRDLLKKKKSILREKNSKIKYLNNHPFQTNLYDNEDYLTSKSIDKILYTNEILIMIMQYIPFDRKNLEKVCYQFKTVIDSIPEDSEIVIGDQFNEKIIYCCCNHKSSCPKEFHYFEDYNAHLQGYYSADAKKLSIDYCNGVGEEYENDMRKSMEWWEEEARECRREWEMQRWEMYVGY